MDLSLERDSSSALGSLFQQIINDLKNTSPLWEDFVTKATKLHQCLRAAIQAIAAYLDAFQKIADAATNSRGASKEIGTALTRVCLRHKAVESRLKTFTTAIMDCLVQPLQEKLEDWKRTVITIDKEHAKEYKRCRTELKKRSSDTLRLQKKARKGQSDTIQSLMDSHKQDVTLRRAELEEVEKKSLRSAMIEERLRYCTFVHMLQPVVKEECEVMSELGHLQEAMDSIALVTKEPSVLPQASEELIHDTKATMSLYPESPGGGSSSQGGCSNSLGSRKSSVCSISSMNSSGSSNSPGHHHYPRSLSQLISPAIRLKPGESSDSGFCSSPALTTQATTATSQSHAVSTWPPHSQDAVPVLPPASDRPHTISTAYEKGHQRPPLTVYTFQNPETILEGSGGSGSIPGTPNGTSGGAGSGANTPSTQKSPAGALSRPPLPVRCSSLERPLSANNNRSTNNLLQRQCPSPIPAHITKGGVTRIARRSSVNTAKPPPPVRRSSSVTPSHNATGTAATQSSQQNQQQQQHYQHPQQLHHLHSHANQQPSPATTTTIHNSHYDTVDSLPPPPAYLLDSRQAQPSTPTPPPPSAVSASAIPSSSLKVAETVKALSAMRHKPASPNAIRHMQQQQQQQLQHSHQSLQNIYSTTVKTFSSTALLPPDCNTEQTLHYDAYSYYNPYMEVSRTTTQLTSAKMPLTNANHANAAANEAAYQTLPITPTSIYYYDAVTTQPTTTIATKSQYLQSNALPDTYGVHTTIRSTPTKANNPPVSPSYTSPPPYDFQHSKIELPPPLPPPNPNQQRSLKQQQQQQQQQQKQFADHQYNTQATSTPHPTQYQYTNNNNNNQLQQKRQHEQIYDYLPSHQHLPHSPKLQHKPPQQQQQQPSQIQQQQQQLAHHLDALMIDNEDEATVYSDNASFRTSSPGIYAQPKIVTSMSSFRSGSPAPTNDHHNQHHHVIPPTQPKTNPNLIAQLSARLSKQNQQQHTSDGIYGSTPNSPNHHNMHQQQQQQHQHQHHQSEPVYMRNYTHPHHQQQQQMSSVATGSMHQQQNYDAGYASSNIEKAGSIRSKTKAEFLENLNAKLAKQGLSGRAFAVRNLINSKALPDPRICHESLMDQIKRGATLKRNQKINDRSAPKIH